MADATVAAEGKPLTGAKVLAMLLAFFAVVFGVNGLMMFDAISTFRGQISDHPYEAGIKFNSELAAAAAQNARGWKVEMTMTDGVRATFRDAEGRPVAGLAVSGVFAAPADVKRDRVFAMAETSPGVYAGPAAPTGVWEYRLTAKRGAETLFQTASRLTLDVPVLAERNDAHWRAGLTLAGRDAYVTFRDTDGRPVAGLAVSGVFAAPKNDGGRDRAFTAAETRQGDYAIDPAALATGRWDLEIVARRGAETPFRSRNEVVVR
jgi:nitrogen fixation protein FixH